MRVCNPDLRWPFHCHRGRAWNQQQNLVPGRESWGSRKPGPVWNPSLLKLQPYGSVHEREPDWGNRMLACASPELTVNQASV